MTNKTENILFEDIAKIINLAKLQLVSNVNSILTITFWNVGKKINDHILHNERAEYGKEIMLPLAKNLSSKFGKSFEIKNLYRMMQFAEKFSNIEIVVTLSRQLSWSHFVVLIPLKDENKLLFMQKKLQMRNGRLEKLGIK